MLKIELDNIWITMKRRPLLVIRNSKINDVFPESNIIQ